MAKIIRKKGKVVELIDLYTFKVQYGDNVATVHLAKKIESNLDKAIELGDGVIFEMSPYDLSRGRIHRDSFNEYYKDLNFD